MRTAATLFSTGLLMAGCAHRLAPAPTEALAPDPFSYEKVSAVCTVGPLQEAAGGRATTMNVRSDDGLCVVPVSQPGGGAYASFLLQGLPEHGKVAIHNYGSQTLIDYTPDTAYAGPDSFSVSLVPNSDGARSLLRVTAMVDATGVPRPVVPLISAPPPSHSSSTHHTTHHRVVKKSASN